MGKVSKPISEIIRRLTWATLAGQDPVRPLAGLTFHPAPIHAIKEDKNFPYAILEMPKTREKILKRAGRSEVYEAEAIDLHIQFSVLREKGIVNDVNDGLTQMGERIMDAICTYPDGSGKPDPFLDSSISTAVTLTVSEGHAFEKSLEARILVQFVSKPFTSNQRNQD